MTNRRYVVLSVVASVVFAASTGAFLWSVRQESRRAVRGDVGVETLSVVVATADLKPGTLVGLENTRVTTREVGSLPKGAVSAADQSLVLGKRTGALILAGEAIVSRRLVAARSPLDAVGAGYAAVTIGVDPVRALGGELTAGMRVTVFTAAITGDVVALIEDAEVLSASNQIGSEPVSDGLLTTPEPLQDVSWVTLKVPVTSVASVVKAAQAGQAYLARFGSDGGA